MTGKMKKNILFIIISLLTAVIFLSTAAVCNLCSGLSTIADNIENSQLSQTQASSSNTADRETSEEESNGGGQGNNVQQDQQQEDHPEAPEISIFKYEGPFYIEDGDLCGYKVGAEVYGYPYPEVVWSRDDSGGELGDYDVQINLRRGETYLLEATATNYLDSKSSKIELSWECDENVVEEQQVDQDDELENNLEPNTFKTTPIGNETGVISTDGSEFYHSNPNLFVGEQNSLFYNSYISFDISSLSPTNVIDSAELFIGEPRIYDDIELLGNMQVHYLYYGNGPLNSSANNVSSTLLLELDNNAGQIFINSENLVNALQAFIRDGKERFQIKIKHMHDYEVIYAEDSLHGKMYSPDNISLAIDYY
jgi:hypothetical protein